MSMRLLIRSLDGGPAPQEVQADGESTVSELLAQLSSPANKSGARQSRHRLVYQGRVLKASSSRKLRDVVEEGSVLVLLAGRVPEPPPQQPAAAGPSLREINAAIREDLAQQGVGREEAGGVAARWRRRVAAQQRERAAERQAAEQQRAERPQGDAVARLLREAMLAGGAAPMSAYMEQLQAELEVADRGGGAAAGPAAVVAALEALLGGQGTLQALLAGMVPDASEEEEPVGGDEDVDVNDYDEEEEDGEGLASLQSSYESLSEEEEEEEEDEGFTEDESDDVEEEEEDEEEEEGLPPLQVPEPDPAALATLAELGFSDALCRNALLWGRNNLQPALDWLIGHAEDPAAAEPLSEAQLASLYGRRAAPRQHTVDERALATLQEMGFGRAQAEHALRVCDGMVEPAVLWLLRMGRTAATGPAGDDPSAAGPAAQPARAAQPAAGASPQEPREEQGPSAASAASSGSLPAIRGSSSDSDASAGSSGDGGAPAGREERAGEGARGCRLRAGAEEAGSAAQQQRPHRDDDDSDAPPSLTTDSSGSDSGE